MPTKRTEDESDQQQLMQKQLVGLSFWKTSVEITVVKSGVNGDGVVFWVSTM